MTSTVRPVPPRPAPTLVRRARMVDPVVEVAVALAHRSVRRSSQAAATALQELDDAAKAARVLQAVHLPGSPTYKAAGLRLARAMDDARTAGATTAQIAAALRGVLR